MGFRGLCWIWLAGPWMSGFLARLAEQSGANVRCLFEETFIVAPGTPVRGLREAARGHKDRLLKMVEARNPREAVTGAVEGSPRQQQPPS